MKNAENVTLTLLVCTTTILLALLVGSWISTEPAYGSSSSSKDGDYIMSVGSYNNETDFIYVVDIASAQLNIYFPNINTNSLTLGDTVDLSKAFGAVPKR
jgi:hypothetical protein